MRKVSLRIYWSFPIEAGGLSAVYPKTKVKEHYRPVIAHTTDTKTTQQQQQQHTYNYHHRKETGKNTSNNNV